jgi:hypothetical protein
MKRITEAWKRYLNENLGEEESERDQTPDEGAWLVRLGLSRVDHERLASVGGSVPELAPDAPRRTWNINNSVLAIVDGQGDHWFKRPHREHQLDVALDALERAGYSPWEHMPVPMWSRLER